MANMDNVDSKKGTLRVMFVFAVFFLVTGIFLVIMRVNVGLASFVLSLSVTTIIYYFLGGIKKDIKITIKDMPFYGAAALIVSLTIVLSYIIGSSYSSDSSLTLTKSNDNTFYETVHPSVKKFGFILGEIRVGRIGKDEISSKGFLYRDSVIRELDNLNGDVAFLYKNSKQLSSLEIKSLKYKLKLPTDVGAWLKNVNLIMDGDVNGYHFIKNEENEMIVGRLPKGQIADAGYRFENREINIGKVERDFVSFNERWTGKSKDFPFTLKAHHEKTKNGFDRPSYVLSSNDDSAELGAGKAEFGQVVLFEHEEKYFLFVIFKAIMPGHAKYPNGQIEFALHRVNVK